MNNYNLPIYSTKGVNEIDTDQFTIDTITFPEEKLLMGLRHGTWSGYSIGFDPVTVTSSKMGLSTDMSVDAYQYKMKDLWNTMSHLGKSEEGKNPITQMDSAIEAMVDYPKRVRYTMLPNQSFDPKFKEPNQKLLENRQGFGYINGWIETFKNIN